MGVTPYQGTYLGTLWVFDPVSEANDCPVKWPELACSRDGIKWHRSFPSETFVPTGPEGSTDSKQIRMSASLVVRDNEILLLYGQTNRRHSSVDMRIEIGMAHLRLDGFAAMSARKQEGSILTKALRFASGQLRVNAADLPRDYVNAEILDSNRNTLSRKGVDTGKAARTPVSRTPRKHPAEAASGRD